MRPGWNDPVEIKRLLDLGALAEIEAIAAVEGVDGNFIGPADLAASMGLSGQPQVKAAVLAAVRRITAAGKPAGVLSLDQPFLRELVAAATTFTAVNVDSSILLRGASFGRRLEGLTPRQGLH